MSSRAKISALTTAVVLGAALGTTGRALAQYNGSWITPENSAQAKPAAPAQDAAATSIAPAGTWDVKEMPAKGVVKSKDAAANKTDTGKTATSAKKGSAPKAAETKPVDLKVPAKKAAVTKTHAVQAAGKTAAEPKSGPAAKEKAPPEPASAGNTADAPKASEKQAGIVEEQGAPQPAPSEAAAPVAAQAPAAPDAAPEDSTNAQAAEPAQASEPAPQPEQQSAAAEDPPAPADAHHSSGAVHAAPGLFVVLPNEMPISGRLVPGQ